MEPAAELLRRAREAEELAAVVSYGPDKDRLLRQAEDLRRQAERGDPGPREHRA